jgi:hypothetical protein
VSPASANPAVQELPESRDLVERYDALIDDHAPELIDFVAGHHDALRARGLSPLTGSGWPLRPFFVSKDALALASEATHRAMVQTAARLAELLDTDRDAFRQAVPIDDDIVDALRPREAFTDPGVGLVLRPDGFLFADRFVLTEPNMGNGFLISCAYPELVYDFLAASPATRALGHDDTAAMQRPADAIDAMILGRLSPGEDRPVVAFLVHHEEHDIIESWGERPIGLVHHYVARLADKGVDVVVVHEDEIGVEDGVARLKDGRVVSLVFQVPIGTHFLYRPDLLRGPLAHFTSPRVGGAPFLQPLAHLLLDKGTMPFVQTLGALPAARGDVRVEVAASFWPSHEHARDLRVNKDRYVIKRSFEGKDTFVGVSAPGRPWNRVVAEAIATRDYVVQEYVPMPRAIMPMVIDGRVERVPVRVELSLLVVDGRYAGGFARYAPDAEGLVLSPPPDDMGFTVLWAS